LIYLNYPPRILPCCEKTVCYKCFQSIHEKSKDGIFKCLSCKQEETMHKKGFIVNKPLMEFITKKPKNIYRGSEAENLKQNIAVLEEIVRKLSFEIENSEYLIRKECTELIRQVQLAKEKLIDEINQFYFKK